MRQRAVYKSIQVAVVVSMAVINLSCEAKTTPQGPELGAIEAYLQEHPEEREDDPSQAQSAQEEFDASK